MEMQEKRIFLENYLRVDRRIDRLCEIQSIWRACAIRIQGMTGQALWMRRSTDRLTSCLRSNRRPSTPSRPCRTDGFR